MSISESSSSVSGLRPRGLGLSRAHLGLVAILLLSAGLHFIALSRNGYGNEYYAVTVRSMLHSWHNFFFAAYDPGGFVSVDKPAFGFWVQAASAAIFGFHGLSLLLPQALAGLLSVGLVYHLVQRVFGRAAGLIAALVLALTPISVATSRSNNLDMLLTLTLLLAAWALIAAVESSRLRWLLISAALIGVGFNIKMMQALTILPALYLVYLLGAKLGLVKRLGHLALATGMLLVVALSWAVIVDTTPAEQRPLVGSSGRNSVLDLMIGYNGIARIMGLDPPAGQPGEPAAAAPNGPANEQSGPPSTSPPANAQPGGPANEGPPPAMMIRYRSGFGSGDPGPLRLFNKQLGGQLGWLLPLAIVGLIAVARQIRWQLPLDRRAQGVTLWAVWLVTLAAIFSFGQGTIHPYYLVTLAPAVAALVGIGLVALWQSYRQAGAAGWLLPLALVVTAAVQARIVSYYPAWSGWLLPVIGVALLATVALIVARLRPLTQRSAWQQSALVIGGLALLLAPSVWSVTPVLAQGDATLPFSGPELFAEDFRIVMSGTTPPETQKLVDFLRSQQQGETYLLATFNSQVASSVTLMSDQHTVSLGGFIGGDAVVTPDRMAELVQSRAVRFVMLATRELEFAPTNLPVRQWVKDHCQPVDAALWEHKVERADPFAGVAPAGVDMLAQYLFDCAPR